MNQSIIHTTQSQAEIWTACKLGGIDSNRAYNESISIFLRGPLNEKTLLKAIQILVDRHDSLRSTFSNDGFSIIVSNGMSITVDNRDISSFEDIERDRLLKSYISADANYIFDLVNGPLFKVGLIKLSETEHHLILTAHHIICDGQSMEFLVEELGHIYSGNIRNSSHNLPKPESFKTYAEEQHIFLG